ncbi:MAG TPA: FG-GAP-like repeat-containing protein [Silvibacterium sp.]|nr:FG-GAP-like repeat-containing protein [Silvibacterium sp.]
MLTTLPCTRALCARGALVIALVLGPSFTSQAQNSAVNFTSSQPIPLGSNCSNVILAGRFQKTSDADLVTSCFSNDPFNNGPFTAALLNAGDGLYIPVPDHSVDFDAVPVQTADLNNDGYSDLIEVDHLADNGFRTQLSNGDGTFQDPVSYSVPSGLVVSAVTGDFEHNGLIDVAVLVSATINNGGGPNNLTIFLNDGTGKLTQSATYALNSTPSGYNHPILVAGDINNDGRTDVTVVYTGVTGTAVPYISQGNGKFTKGSARSAGDSPITAAWGDFNKDGYGDIAVSTPTGFNILFGSSTGKFTGSKFTSFQTPIASLGAGSSIAPVDFDKDGNLDLAVSANNGVDLFWGAGNGTFLTVSSYASDGGALIAADVNGDGKPDLITSSFYRTSVLYNLGHRGFRGAPNTHSPNANGIVAGDFNRDGKLDVAVVNTPTCAAPCNGNVTVLPGEGVYFNGGPSYTIGMHGSAIAAGDLNGDGILDLVVTNATAGDDADVGILLGTATGGFSSARNLKLGSLSNDAFLADVNGDGKLDLIEDGGVALGDGKGSFGNLTPFPDGIGYTSATYLTVADFNGDGHPDIAIAWPPSTDNQQANLLINDGKGNFSDVLIGLSNDVFEFITGITAGHLKGGTINDLVFTGDGTTSNGNLNNAGFFVLFNDGKGNFSSGPVGGPYLQPGEGPRANGAVIADFNKDGNEDIGFSVGNKFYVSTGPSFSELSTPFTAAVSTPYSTVADFNKDGWPDIVFTSPYGVSRLYNVPVPSVSPGALNFTNAGSQKVTIKNTLTISQAITADFQNGTRSTPGFTISSNTCGTLAAGASCTVTVSYNGATRVGAVLYVEANSQFIAGINVTAP